jgi:hypothetical protein
MGILGAPMMGLFLDKGIDADLKEQAPALHAEVDGGLKETMFGPSPSIDQEKAEALAGDRAATFERIVVRNKKEAFLRQAALPLVLLFVYLGLFLHFRRRGGYRPVEI